MNVQALAGRFRRYEQLMRHLAGHGFIVIAPTVDDNVFAPNFWVRAYWQMGPFS